VEGAAKEKVRELYPPVADLDTLMEKDQERFLQALDRATGLFLKVGPDAGREVGDFAEVIGPVARSYRLREIDLTTAARELGLKDNKTLGDAIVANAELQRLGLLPLTQGRTIKREVWESVEGLLSPFQETAAALEIGTPQRER